MRRMFIGIAVLLFIGAAAAVQAQKGIGDNPFAPGHPFGAISARLDTISGQLDGLIKDVGSLVRRPDGRTHLYTGYLEQFHEGDQFECLLANVGPETLHNAIIRVVDFGGNVLITDTSERAVPITGPLRPGKGWGFGFSVQRFASVRCEFIFDGLPEHVRATISIRGGDVLEAR